ncbi:hypothetical protein [Aeromicrobium sp. 179-A 4D2 NHS]|uniref:hypothetical protein n=1 Tax=Aeromicrobium sp. 179-A 4D2 NHS TaxID=3142375 RepID=UPI00399F8ED9
MSKQQPRNRDIGRGGHPTRFAPKPRSEARVSTLELAADELAAETDTAALDALVSYRDAVAAGDIVPTGLDRDALSGRTFTESLDRQIEYARRGKREAADALRFHNLRLGASEAFTVDGREFHLTLDDGGSTTLSFTTHIESAKVPDVAGMTPSDKRAYLDGAKTAIETTGVKVVSADEGDTTLASPTRPVHFNSLPDCANKVTDVELDAFVQADNYASAWRKAHLRVSDNWLEDDGLQFVS